MDELQKQLKTPFLLTNTGVGLLVVFAISIGVMSYLDITNVKEHISSKETGG